MKIIRKNDEKTSIPVHISTYNKLIKHKRVKKETWDQFFDRMLKNIYNKK